MASMFQAVREIPQPILAAVFGFTLGGGFELALSCDLIVAADTTELALPEARVGLVPGGGGTQLLPRKVGSSVAKELIFTGRRMGAQEALTLGLVARVVSRNELHAAALELARDIGKSSPVAVREAKRIVDATFGVPLEDAIAQESEAWSRVIATADRAEEIAVRVARTCRELGVSPVMVYSDADRGARHAAAGDEAVVLPGSAPSDTYLNAEAILAAAHRSGADAIHPGYGFLSESARFAEAVAAAGLVWVGPPPPALRALGDKLQARRLASEAGGTHLPRPGGGAP